MTAATTRRMAARAKVLQGIFGIEKLGSIGIFEQGSELELIEYVCHEIAHGLTMGFEKFPSVLSAGIKHRLARYSEATNDFLEIDTTFVTHQGMVALKLVKGKDLHKFASKCATALTSNCFSERMYYVLDEMERRSDDFALRNHASTLASIFRAPIPLVKATYLLRADE